MRLLRPHGEVDDGAGLPGEWSEFERIVFYGVARFPGQPHPPAAHGYLRG
ncbi:hypothetical protein ACFW9N_23460 [Streptomyces sp. NPDC059496]